MHDKVTLHDFHCVYFVCLLIFVSELLMCERHRQPHTVCPRVVAQFCLLCCYNLQLCFMIAAR